MNVKKFVPILCSLALLLGLISSCGSSESSDNLSEIKIGHICDLTGTENMTGEEAEEAMEFALDYFYNGEIAGHPVEIITEDSQGSVEGAEEAARKLVEENGVCAIFGPTQMDQKSAVAEYVEEVGVPLFLYNGAPADTLTGEWVVGIGGGTSPLPSLMADYMYNELGYRSIVTLTMDNEGGHSCMDPIAEYFEALGGTVLEQVWVPTPCSDFTNYLESLPQADALCAWESGSDAVALWLDWYTLDLNKSMPMVAGVHGGMTDYFIIQTIAAAYPDVAEAMLGTPTSISWCYSVENKISNGLVEAWQEKYNELPPASNMLGICSQSLIAFADAVEALNGDVSDSSALINAIWDIDANGPEGEVYFANGEHAATKDYYVVELVQLEDDTYNYQVIKTYYDVGPDGLSSNN